MAKKAPKKKKAVKKAAAKKKSKARTPLKDRNDIETPEKAARNTWAEIAAAESDQSWLSEQVSMDTSRYPRIFTGLIDVDTLFAPTIGSRIEITGDAHNGKSTLTYIMIGTLLRTCRRCFTLSVEWIDEETGEVRDTCRCGANELMEGVLVDIERAADPVWLDTWGCRTGRGDLREKMHGSGAFKVLESEKQRRLHIVHPISGGPTYTFLQKAVAKGAVDFVALDSINSLISDEALGKDAGKKNIADRAKMNWDGLRRITSAQNEHRNKFGGRATVIWTNHLIANIGGWEKETEAGGGGAKIFPDQKIRFAFSKVNEGKKEDLPFHSYRETFFNVTKNRAGFVGGGSGAFKLFLNEVKHNRVTYWPGDTDDPSRMLGLLRDLGLFEEKKSKYRVLGREFKRVQDIKDFLNREDIKMECRFWLGALRMPTIARAHLRFEDYCYSPFESARRSYERTAEEIEKKIPGLNVGAALATGGGSEPSGGGGTKKSGGKGKTRATNSSLEDVFDS